MSQRLGKAYIRLGTRTLETMPGATLDIGGDTRTSQIGGWAVLGYTETPKQSRIECAVSLRAGISAQELHAKDLTITFQGDTGQTWSIRGAWSTEPPVVDSGAGTARVIYEGPPAEEIV